MLALPSVVELLGHPESGWIFGRWDPANNPPRGPRASGALDCGPVDCGPAPQQGGEAKGVVSVGEALEWGSTVSQESFHY